MTKQAKRTTKQKRAEDAQARETDHSAKIAPPTFKTPAQKRYAESISKSQITFGIGPAGTGKTWCAAALAAYALASGKIDKIVITRPAVEAGEELGFLPGELAEKYEPWIAPFREVLTERLGKGRVDYAIKAKQVEAVPLAYMRGKTFKNCWVIFDEAQNSTPEQMKMFLTRIGENCTMIVTGDPKQSDLVDRHGVKIANGLSDAIERFEAVPEIQFCWFDKADIVRNPLIATILDCYAA